jgi:hypothetical protein
MPIVEFFTSFPGNERLASNTKVNIIEELAQAVKLTAGRGSVGIFGAVPNDRGAPNIPVRIVPEDIKSLYGGFRSWMGDGVDFGDQDNYNDRGSLSGYHGNLPAQVEALDAPLLVLTVPDLSLYDVTIDSLAPLPTALLVEVDRSGGGGAGVFGSYTLPAGSRIEDGAGTPYIVATLEEVTWIGTDVSAKTVRVRQVSDTTVAPVAINTVTDFIDLPEDVEVVVTTSVITPPFLMNVAEILKRYTLAMDQSITYATGQIAELVCCDRTDLLIVDDLFRHAEDASAEGYFRLACGSPPQGTSASVAQGSATDGVGRTTLKATYGAYNHPGWTRQFPDDSANLIAEQSFQHDIPSAVAFCFNAAQFRPEENPANFTANLTNYRITGVEALTPAPDRKAHEDAGIIQPVIEFANPGGLSARLQPTFNAAPLADAVTKFYTRRFAFFLYKNLLAVSLTYHKAVASVSNQEGLTDAIDEYLEQLLENERIGGYNPTTGSYDPNTKQFTVNVAVLEIGNIDVLTLRVVYGSDLEVSRKAA